LKRIEVREDQDMSNTADPPIITLVVNWLKATGRNQGRGAALIEAQKMLFAVTVVLMREQGPEWARKVLARAALPPASCPPKDA
jgi:hypothetical protein